MHKGRYTNIMHTYELPFSISCLSLLCCSTEISKYYLLFSVEEHNRNTYKIITKKRKTEVAEKKLWRPIVPELALRGVAKHRPGKLKKPVIGAVITGFFNFPGRCFDGVSQGKR